MEMEDKKSRRGGARPGTGHPKGDSRIISFRARARMMLFFLSSRLQLAAWKSTLYHYFPAIHSADIRTDFAQTL